MLDFGRIRSAFLHSELDWQENRITSDSVVCSDVWLTDVSVIIWILSFGLTFLYNLWASLFEWDHIRIEKFRSDFWIQLNSKSIGPDSCTKFYDPSSVWLLHRPRRVKSTWRGAACASVDMIRRDFTTPWHRVRAVTAAVPDTFNNGARVLPCFSLFPAARRVPALEIGARQRLNDSVYIVSTRPMISFAVAYVALLVTWCLATTRHARCGRFVGLK